MIEDIRFVEREVITPSMVNKDGTVFIPATTKACRILQYKINGQWQDVRMEKE